MPQIMVKECEHAEKYMIYFVVNADLSAAPKRKKGYI